MLFYIVPNSDYNTEQVFNLNNFTMILYDFEEEILTIQYPNSDEYEIDNVSEEEYENIKTRLTTSGTYVVRHKQN